MTTQTARPCPEAEQYATLYVLGALSPDETGSFERHLENGCATCREEIHAMEQTASDLAFAAAAPAPSGLRERLMANIGTTGARGKPPTRSETAGPAARSASIPSAIPPSAIPMVGRSTVRSGEIPWEDSPIPGIRFRRLHVDPVARRMTVVVRMEAGASYIPHRHKGLEESFVLEGTVISDGETFSAGDYHRAEAGSIHGVQTTETGCMLLIISSIDDEFLVDSPTGSSPPPG